MEVNSANRSLDLVEADVVKAFKACAANRPYSVVWDQEVLLPPHEYILSLRQTWDMKVTFPSLLLKRAEGGEFGPMRKISLIRRAPILMLCKEGVF